jgi:1-deoxy-D-xylulose 5-phosphate reductoisomerase
VAAFLAGRTSFLAIVTPIESVLDEHLAADPRLGSAGSGSSQTASSLTVDDVLDADRWARQRADAVLGAQSGD